MLLKALPLTFVLAGLALYTALAGADFGAGFWQLFAGRGERAAGIRAHAHRSMGPVWEANHVWLIFVLTVFWTSYPRAFGSIASTLAVPLFIAALGIILRGAAYALRAGASGAGESGVIDTIFSVSSVLTPFALGAAIGAIATGRVPVGNASGHPFSSWLNPTSIFIGLEAAGERKAEQEAERGEGDRAPHRYCHDDPDERVVSRRPVVNGETREDGGPASKRPAGDDRRDRDGRAETRRVEAPPPHERERCHTGEERHDHSSERIAGQQRVKEAVVVAVDYDNAAERNRAGHRPGAQRAPPERVL